MRISPKKIAAFTLMEIMVALAILAILLLIAVPSTGSSVIRKKVNDAMQLADVVKKPIEAQWLSVGMLPKNNAEAGVPDPDKIVSEYIHSIEVDKGAIHLIFGNISTPPALKDKVLTLRPAVVEDEHSVPISWVCGHAPAPDGMQAQGTDKTDIPEKYLPIRCLDKK
jgi:prepilin-type N-terminal cleavage/methylation domain